MGSNTNKSFVEWFKSHGSKALAIVFASMLALSLASGCASQKVDNGSGSPSSGQTIQAAAEVEVSVTIDPSAAVGHVSDDIDTDVFGPESVYLEYGATAYDALAATGAAIEGEPSFVTSVNGLASGAAGPTSGWMYTVNGESPTVAADECTLEQGDEVVWYYVDSFE